MFSFSIYLRFKNFVVLRGHAILAQILTGA